MDSSETDARDSSSSDDEEEDFAAELDKVPDGTSESSSPSSSSGLYFRSYVFIALTWNVYNIQISTGVVILRFLIMQELSGHQLQVSIVLQENK